MEGQPRIFTAFQGWIMIDLKLAFIIIVNGAAGNIESTVKKVSVQQLINDYQLVCDQGSTPYKLQLFDTPLTKCISFHLYLSFKRSQNVMQSKVIAVPKSNSNLHIHAKKNTV